MKKKKLTHSRKKKYNKNRLGTGGPGCKTATLGKRFTKSKKGKKRLTEKQRQSLAKGRKVLSYLRTGRKISEPKEPILIREGTIMGRKAKKHSSKRLHGTEGLAGKSKKHHRSTPAKYLHGAAEGFNPGNLALDLAGILAGAIGLSFVASLVPVKNPKYKALIPMLAGVIGLSMPKIAKNRFINRAALGALSIGGYTLTKQLVPSLPLMGAADTAEGIGAAIENLPPEEKAILGILPAQLEYTGEDDYSGSTEMLGANPGEMLGSNPGEMLGDYPLEMVGANAPGEMLGWSDGESDFE